LYIASLVDEEILDVQFVIDVYRYCTYNKIIIIYLRIDNKN